jgi:spermidine synthase
MTEKEKSEGMALLGTVFVVAACGLVYELLIATISSYLIGSSVTQFSLCIGLFVGAMGFGSWASQYVTTGLLRCFLIVEVLLGVLGGLSAWALYAAYAFLGGGYWGVLIFCLVAIGALVGIELPLLTRILSRYGGLRTTIAQALSFDYIGALIGSVAFPLFLLPTLGTTRTAFVMGIMNLVVALYNLYLFRAELKKPLVPVAVTLTCLLGLGIGCLYANAGTRLLEKKLYEDEILLTKQTPYQRIVITRFKEDLRLYLDGNLQFSANDEYRYHEALIHPAMSLSAHHGTVLLLGGGDGLGVREVIKWQGVEKIILVDIDPAMTHLARTYPALVRQNEDAFRDKRVEVRHEDAFTFLSSGAEFFDVIIADLPDPNNEALAKLYAREFYQMAKKRLARGGMFVTQATSPLFAREAFWSIEATVQAAGLKTLPYHVYVPSFGDWGFILATPEPNNARLDLQKMTLPIPLRYLSSVSVPAMIAFDADSNKIPAEVSTLDFPKVLRYYERGSKKWE